MTEEEWIQLEQKSQDDKSKATGYQRHRRYIQAVGSTDVLPKCSGLPETKDIRYVTGTLRRMGRGRSPVEGGTRGSWFTTPSLSFGDFGFPPDFFSERKVDFVACDMPSANAFMINVYAAVAQEERRMISDRTKAGLAEPRRGVSSSAARNCRQSMKRGTRAPWREHGLLHRFSELAGMSARSVAAVLNARQVKTPSGAPWSAKTVIRARERLAVTRG